MTGWLPAALAGAAVVAAGGSTGAAGRRLRAVSPVPAGRRPQPDSHPPAGGPLTALFVARTGADRSRRLGTAVAAAGAVLALWFLGPAAAVLLVGAGIAGVRVVRARVRELGRAGERRQAVEACVALAAELRAGRPPAVALAVAAEVASGPAHQALSAAAGVAAWGGDVPGALLAATPVPSAVPEVLRGMAACWRVCAQAGSGLAASVERLADGLRARQVQERAVGAALAGPRASGALLAGLPLAGIALAAGLGADPLHVLLHTRPGSACLALGVGLDALGLWWTGRIVARAAGVRV